MNKRKILIKFIAYDMLASLIVWVLFMVFRRTVNDAQIFENVNIFIPNYNYFSSLILFPLSCAFIHYLSGFYLHPEKQSKTTLMLTTLAASVIISISIFSCCMLDDIVVSYEYYYYSLLVLFGLLFFITYFSGRFLLPILISATKQKNGILTP